MQKNLFNSQNFQKPISIKGLKKDNLKKILKLIIYIRKTEQILAQKKRETDSWSSTFISWSRSNCSWCIAKFKKN